MNVRRFFGVFIMLPVLVLGCSKKLSSLVSEVDPQRSALLKYYQVNGRFPLRIDEIDSKYSDSRGFGEAWYYSSGGDSYQIMRPTGGFKEGLFFKFDPRSRKNTGWFLYEDDGSPPRKLETFGLADAEEEFFRKGASGIKSRFLEIKTFK
jgi:hypothetical protein